jgi:hypothetical protein
VFGLRMGNAASVKGTIGQVLRTTIQLYMGNVIKIIVISP